MVEKFEAKLFLNEKNKRLKQGLTWKKYADQVLKTINNNHRLICLLNEYYFYLLMLLLLFHFSFSLM